MNQSVSNPQVSPPEGRNAVELRNVSQRFVGKDGAVKEVLNNFNLSIPEGELTVLIGRSGCGKTTVLNLVAGLMEPTDGAVDVLGTTPRRARDRVGYMFARDALLPWRTAQRNVEYGLELRKVPKAERSAKSSELLDALGLGDSRNLFPWQLSQGMRQRAALARTWAIDPELVLMDEPFAALDSQTKITARAQFMKIWESRKRTCLFVTHDLSEALLVGDRVILLDAGEIQVDMRAPFAHPRNTEELMHDEEFTSLQRELWQRLR